MGQMARHLKTEIKKTEKRVRALLTESKTTSGHKSEMARLIKRQAIERGEWPHLSSEIKMNLTMYSNMDLLMAREA